MDTEEEIFNSATEAVIKLQEALEVMTNKLNLQNLVLQSEEEFNTIYGALHDVYTETANCKLTIMQMLHDLLEKERDRVLVANASLQEQIEEHGQQIKQLEQQIAEHEKNLDEQ